MTTTSVKVSAKYQIAVPQIARKKLNIKKGDRLLVHITEAGMIFLEPQPKRYTDRLAGLHKEIWAGVNSQEYINAEREAWKG